MKKYIALFEMKNDGVGVVFPDIPGLFSAGNNFQTAQKNAHEALALYAEDTKRMPKARNLEQIKEEWEDWQEWENNYNFVIGFVDLLPIKAKNKRINITLPEDLLIRLDNITDNRSGFIDTALRAMLKI